MDKINFVILVFLWAAARLEGRGLVGRWQACARGAPPHGPLLGCFAFKAKLSFFSEYEFSYYLFSAHIKYFN